MKIEKKTLVKVELTVDEVQNILIDHFTGDGPKMVFDDWNFYSHSGLTATLRPAEEVAAEALKAEEQEKARQARRAEHEKENPPQVPTEKD